MLSKIKYQTIVQIGTQLNLQMLALMNESQHAIHQ